MENQTFYISAKSVVERTKNSLKLHLKPRQKKDKDAYLHVSTKLVSVNNNVYRVFVPDSGLVLKNKHNQPLFTEMIALGDGISEIEKAKGCSVEEIEAYCMTLQNKHLSDVWFEKIA